jgi:hypothetical protein
MGKEKKEKKDKKENKETFASLRSCSSVGASPCVVVTIVLGVL